MAVLLAGFLPLAPVLAPRAAAALQVEPGDSGGSGVPAELSTGEEEGLTHLAALLTLFDEEGDVGWTGYDLCARPLLVYVPGRWAVLLNGGEGAPEGRPWPTDWPEMPCGDPLLLPGTLEGLVGQLAFDHRVGEVTTVAIPLLTQRPEGYGSLALANLGFFVHEAFHQFQRDRFEPVDTPPEERYPVLDAENNALAALEMHLLADAVQALTEGGGEGARGLGIDYLAVRDRRMAGAPELVRGFERAKELVEGTAKYVEVEAIGRIARACRSAAPPPPALTEVCPHVSGLSATTYLVDDFRARLVGGALEPEDVPRNRVYPVGAALALLLDAVQPGWKERIPPGTHGLTDLLRESLGPAPRPDRFAEAAARYDLPALLRISQSHIESYLSAYEEELTAFRTQGGILVEVAVDDRGLRRSRSSRVRRWVMDGGETVFAREFDVFTLRRDQDPAFAVEVHGRGVLEQIPADGPRRVVFHVDEIERLVADGDPVPSGPVVASFERLEAEGDGFSVTVRGGGRIVREEGLLRIDATAR